MTKYRDWSFAGAEMQTHLIKTGDCWRGWCATPHGFVLAYKEPEWHRLPERTELDFIWKNRFYRRTYDRMYSRRYIKTLAKRFAAEIVAQGEKG